MSHTEVGDVAAIEGDADFLQLAVCPIRCVILRHPMFQIEIPIFLSLASLFVSLLSQFFRLYSILVAFASVLVSSFLFCFSSVFLRCLYFSFFPFSL